jgi:hypothetical protein
VVALLEPFIDTIVICTMTALVIIVTSSWDDRVPTALTFTGGHMSFVEERDDGRFNFFVSAPEAIEVQEGVPVETGPGVSRSWPGTTWRWSASTWTRPRPSPSPG